MFQKPSAAMMLALRDFVFRQDLRRSPRIRRWLRLHATAQASVKEIRSASPLRSNSPPRESPGPFLLSDLWIRGAGAVTGLDRLSREGAPDAGGGSNRVRTVRPRREAL